MGTRLGHTVSPLRPEYGVSKRPEELHIACLEQHSSLASQSGSGVGRELVRGNAELC